MKLAVDGSYIYISSVSALWGTPLSLLTLAVAIRGHFVCLVIVVLVFAALYWADNFHFGRFGVNRKTLSAVQCKPPGTLSSSWSNCYSHSGHLSGYFTGLLFYAILVISFHDLSLDWWEPRSNQGGEEQGGKEPKQEEYFGYIAVVGFRWIGNELDTCGSFWHSTIRSIVDIKKN